MEEQIPQRLPEHLQVVLVEVQIPTFLCPEVRCREDLGDLMPLLLPGVEDCLVLLYRYVGGLQNCRLEGLCAWLDVPNP